MAVLNTGLAKTSAGDFTIDYSCRFNGTTSYFSRTPASAGNLKTYTCSVWVKRGNVTGYEYMFSAYDAGASQIAVLSFDINEYLHWHLGGASNYRFYTTPQYRDPSAWYHIVFSCDTSTAGGRATTDMQRIYVNNVLVTDKGSTVDPVADYEGLFNDDTLHTIGRNAGASDAFVTGTMAEIHFIDGTALTPSSFGETGDYGEWKPIEVTGLTYGTNGYYLDFADSAALGNDVSGNNNDWTANNIDASDQMLDTPTNNFCTLNPLRNYSAMGTNDGISEGNLKVSDTTNWINRGATFGVSSGKWYWEIFCETCDANAAIGIVDTSTGGYTNNSSAIKDSPNDGYGYCADGRKKGTGVAYTSYGDSYTTDDIISVALDMDAGTIKFYKNDTVQDSGTAAFTGITGTYEAWVEEGTSGGSPHSDFIFNFGQDSSFAGTKTAQGNQDGNSIGDFYYTPPTDFLALCTANLPDVAVTPSEHFNTVLYTGDGSGSGSQAITGVGFQPDLVWLKSRSQNWSHSLINAISGASVRLRSQSTGIEQDITGQFAFGADGFTVTDGGNSLNNSPNTYVAWNWKANGSGSANNAGDLDATVSANTDAGFSIVKYVGNNVDGATVAHGLSKAPEMIILKTLETVKEWAVGHDGMTWDSYQILSGSMAMQTSDYAFDQVAPTSTLFSVGAEDFNYDTEDHIAYCFHSVDGFSKVGTYEGNNSTDGTFVYTGFRPAYVMVKNIDNTGDWTIVDTAREPVNVSKKILRANVDNTEYDNAVNAIDILSNGFKLRNADNDMNDADTYIYLAFAETPFKYSNAR